MVEERGGAVGAVAETAGDDGGGVEEAFGEDWDCGELVMGLVGVVDDHDLGPGWDGLGREALAEADWAGPRAFRADGPPCWLWFCGRGEVVGGVFWVHCP